MKFKHVEKGFTLIELMVVFSIFAVLSTIGVAAFVSFSRTQTLNAAASDIKSMLNLAKSRAYSQVKPSVTPCNTSQLDGYKVKIDSMGGSYDLIAQCGGLDTAPIRTGRLPSGYSFTTGPPTPPSTFFFPVIKGGVVGNGNVGINNGFGQWAIISVSSDGNIN